jgi:hypothetical protein
MDGGSVAQLSGTIATDRHGRRECQTIVWNNRGRPTSNAAGVAEIVADNFRHSRHIWTHPVCKTFDHRSEKKSLLSYIRPVLEGFWLPGPNGYLRSSSSSSFRPCDGLGVNQVLNEPV